MKRILSFRFTMTGTIAILAATAGLAGVLGAKENNSQVDSSDVTLRLFQLLDDSHGIKLTDFYVLGDVFKNKDSMNPDEEELHVFRIDYDKNRNFGKLNLHVRTLIKPEPDQLKTYTAKQLYDFGNDDTEKFLKTDSGELGREGDRYFRSTASGIIVSTPITDEVRKSYTLYLSQYIIPALQRK